jgi:hypothetical protein
MKSHHALLRLWLLALVAVLLGVATANAVSYTWTGTISSDWTVVGNWSPSGSPGVNDTAVINGSVSSGRYPIITSSQSITNNAITVNSSGSGASLTVDGSLTVNNGGLTVSAGGTCTVDASGSLSTVNSYPTINGTLNTAGTINCGQNIGSGSGTINISGGTFTMAQGADINANLQINMTGGVLGCHNFNTGNTITMTGSSVLQVAGTLNPAPASTFTGGTVDYNGNNPSINTALAYHNLELGAPAGSVASLGNNITITGNLSIDNGNKLNLGGHNVNVNTFTTGGTTVNAGTYTQTTTSGFLTGGGNVIASAGPASKLAFTTQPVTTPAGQTMANVVVQIQDSSGNAVAQSGTAITVSLSSGSFAGGTTTVNTDASGKATFTNLVITAANTYTMTAQASSLTSATSSSFTVVAGAASRLVITSVNSGASPTAGAPFSVGLQAQDSNGNPANVVANTAVTLSLNTGTGILGGTLTGTISAGSSSVTISGVTYSKAESGIIITATRTSGDNLSSENSSPFTVIAGAASRLFITSVNGGLDATAGIPFSVVVQSQSTNGTAANVVANTAVTLSLNTGSGILGGTLTGTIAAGTNSATISGVTYSKAETNVIITATRTSGDNLSPTNSAPFTVIAGAFAQLQVLMPGETAAPGSGTGKTGSPTPQTVNTPLNVIVNAVDANWNLISTNDTVHLTSTDSSALLPANVPLSGGTGTFTITFLTTGLQTVTASDVTHPGIASNTGSLTVVNKGNQTITFPSPGNRTYGAAPITLAATASSGLPVIYTVTNGPATVSGDILTITGAGSVSIQATQAGDANWNPATPVSQTISVAPKVVSPVINVSNKTYDGNTSATISARFLSGVINSDDVSLTGGTATFSDPIVGTGKTVTATGLALSGTQAGNYVLSSTTATTSANITAATVTIASGLSANSKVYDGTPSAGLSTNNVLLNGVLPADSANVSLATNGYVANFDTATVGTNKPVMVSGLTLTGSAAPNYTLIQPTNLTAAITGKTVTVTSGLSANNKIYDATTSAGLSSNNVVLFGVVAADNANVSLSTNGYLANFDTASVGNNKPVTVSGLTLTGSAAANYTLIQPTSLTANITVATVTIASGVSANNKVYDGTTNAGLSTNIVVLTGVAASDTANVALGTNGYVANFASPTVGNAKPVTVSGLTLTGTAAGNYTLTQPTTLTANITAATVTIASGLSANNKAYDGTTTATLSSNNVVLLGVLPGDSANVSLSTNAYVANFASASVGNSKPVAVSGLTLTGSAAGNYTLTQPTTLTANIIGKTVTIASGVGANDKVYDGTTTATLSSNNVVLLGVLPADTANVSLSTNGYAANFNTATVGNNKPVTVSGLTLTGSAASNYTLTQPTNLTANITAKTVTIASGVSANNKVYDTTTSASLRTNNVVLTGVAASDIANVSLSTNGYVANFANPAVGTNKPVAVSGLTLTGSAATNYTLTQPTGLTADIIPATVTIASGLTAENKEYDATTSAGLSSSNVVLIGVLAADTANVSLATNGYVANFNTASVGTNKPVTVSGLTLTGTAAGNYTLTQPTTLTADITGKTVTIASGLTANNKVADGTTTASLSSNSVVLVGVLAADTNNVFLSTNGYVANFDTATAGTNKPVTVSGLRLTGPASANYTLTQPSLRADIAPGPVAKLEFTTQPGLAASGTPFGQQPVVKSQDQFGNDSTVGLPASLIVTITLTNSTGPLLGTVALDIGTASGNGTVTYADLQINSPGAKQLTASAGSLASAVSDVFYMPNAPPVVNTASMARPRNVPLKILISDLLTNATDADVGDTLRLVGVSSSSTNGAPLYTNATFVLYSLPPGGNVADSFTQTVSDGLDSTNGTVLLSIKPDPTGTNFNQVASSLVGGLPAVTFIGIPGRSYHVQRTQDLSGTPAWTDLITTNAPAGALFQFVDPSPPAGPRYYRAINL